MSDSAFWAWCVAMALFMAGLALGYWGALRDVRAGKVDGMRYRYMDTERHARRTGVRR